MLRRGDNVGTGDEQVIHDKGCVGRDPQWRPHAGRSAVAVNPQHAFTGVLLQVHRAHRPGAGSAHSAVRLHLVVQIEVTDRVVDHGHAPAAARTAIAYAIPAVSRDEAAA